MSYLSEILIVVGAGFVTWFVLVSFFTPRIDYRLSVPPRLDGDEFLHVLQATCQAVVVPGNRVEILTNGSRFYASMLDAIRRAPLSVNLEAYIFQPGEIAERFIDALVGLDGPMVTALQGLFAENWLECSGEILMLERQQ